MKKGIILVHFLNGMKPPKLYRMKKRARDKCLKDPGYEIIECNDENQAQNLFALKMDEHKDIVNKNRIAILEANLYKFVSADSSKSFTASEQSKFIDEEQRTAREKIVNEIFCQHGHLPSPTFKSLPIFVSPLVQYEGFFDGASKGNRGPASFGYLIKHFNTTLLQRCHLMQNKTNNQAELMGLGFLLADSYCNNIQRLRVAGDSKLAINFMKGNQIIYNQNIQSLVQGNKKLKQFFQAIRFVNIDKSLNKEAHKLANSPFKKRKNKDDSKIQDHN